MPLECAGSFDRSAEQAAERVNAQAETRAELNNLGEAVEASEQSETTIERAARLGQFVEAYFAELCPPEHRPIAIEECRLFEDDCRGLFEEPALCLAEEDAEDPELRAVIAEKVVQHSVTVSENNAAVANEANLRQQNQAAANELAAATATEPEAPVDLAHTEMATNARTNAQQETVTRNDNMIDANDQDLSRLEQLQAEFAHARAESQGDVITALRLLLKPGRLESDAMRERIQATMATAEALTMALPGKSEVVTRLLNASSLDLSAGGGAATFADFMNAVDASDELTDADKTKLREVLHRPAEVKTGSDIKAAFAQGPGVIEQPDGSTRPLAYDEAHRVELAAGISVYPNGHLIRGTAKIAGRSFPFRASANISGSALTEQLNCHAANAIKESAGVTGGSKQGFEATQGTKELDLSGELFETQAVRFGKLTFENLIDGFDANSSLISEAQVRQMQWGFQWLMPQRDALGDGGYGDNNETARMAALGGGGHDGLIWDGNDNLNEENYRRACQFIRDQGRSGASEPDFGALVAHLESMSGIAEAA